MKLISLALSKTLPPLELASLILVSLEPTSCFTSSLLISKIKITKVGRDLVYPYVTASTRGLLGLPRFDPCNHSTQSNNKKRPFPSLPENIYFSHTFWITISTQLNIDFITYHINCNNRAIVGFMPLYRNLMFWNNNKRTINTTVQQMIIKITF